MTPADALLPSPALVGGVPVYLTGEDAIRLTARNAAAGVTLILAGRFLPARCRPDDPPPRVGVFAHTLVPTTDRVASVRTETLGEGWLLDWSVVASAGTPATGQCFVSVSIARGDSGAVLELSALGQGYVTSAQRLSGPGAAMTSSVDGAGALRLVAGAAPAAGAEFSLTVPTGARWELLSVFATLTTAVAVANRVPSLLLDDGVTVFDKSSQQQQQAASLAWDYLWAPGDQNQSAGNVLLVTSSLPHRVWLGAGFRARSLTSAIQAADQWSAPQALVREWIEGA